MLLVFRANRNLEHVIERLLAATGGGLVGCALPVLFFYGFKLREGKRALSLWISFVSNPGGDDGFYSQLPH